MTTKTATRKIETGVLQRTLSFDRSSVNEEDRTVELAFSSEASVERWFGNEVLSHEPQHVDLGRLNSGGALLVDHDPSDHVGVIEKASIDSDRIGRAVVRFGKSTRAQEIYQDVLDGIRKNISVGYRIYEMVEDKLSNTFTATRWQPFEVSFVAIPADASVGVGRELDDTTKTETIIHFTEERTMPPEIEKQTPAPVIDEKAVRDQIRKDEMKRASEIRALGKEHNLSDLAEKAINEDYTVEQMRCSVLDSLKESKPMQPAPKAEIGLTQKEARKFSMLRALNALANPNDRRAQENAAFEIECSNAVAQQRGIDTAGFFVPSHGQNGFVDSRGNGMHTNGIAVPYEVQHYRDLSAGTATDGAELVAENLLSGSFIDVLRNASVVAGMGATMMTDLVGDVAIPRKTSGSAAAWVATEGGNVAQSDPQFDQVLLSPKTAGVYTEVTRQLLKQSSIDVENLIRNDFAAGMALLLDLAALYGTGATGQPQGIKTATGVNTPTAFAGANPTYAEVVAMETAVADVNALMNSLGYVLNTSMRGALKTTVKESGQAMYVWEPGNRLNDYKTGVSNQVAAGDLFFGNWADLLIGAWGNLDLLIDPYTNSLSGTVRVVAHQSIDLALRHGQSFAYNT